MNHQNNRLFRASLIALIGFFLVIGNASLLADAMGFSSLNIGFAKHKHDVGPNHYTLQFHTIDGEQLNTPLYFDAIAERFGVDNVWAGEQLINEIGIAYFADDVAMAEQLMEQFKQEFLLGVNSAEYDLIFLVFNPVERFNWNSNVAEQIVASFRYGEAISQVSP